MCQGIQERTRKHRSSQKQEKHMQRTRQYGNGHWGNGWISTMKINEVNGDQVCEAGNWTMLRSSAQG